MPGIDPRAAVAEGAVLAAGVSVGPFAVIGPQVTIGAGSDIDAHAVLEGKVTLGRNNYVAPFACIGAPPQHVAYRGEPTEVAIGDNNRIREHVTIHRGTPGGRGVTRLGNDNFIMVGVHIAHDCAIGDRIIMANLVTLGGHVEVEDDAVFGGLAGVHQYCRIGRVVMIAAMSKVVQDAPPYTLVGGEPVRFMGLNRVGLKRVGLPEDAKTAIRKAYREIFATGARLEEALQRVAAEYGTIAEVRHLVEFIRGSQRGIIRE